MDKISEIEALVDQGKLKLAKKMVGDFIKSKALDAQERVRLSEIYRLTGSIDKGIKVLGTELSHNELQAINEEVLAQQIRLAYMVHYIGARYAARRIFNNLEDISRNRNINLSHVDPRYHRYLSGFYLGSWDFKKAYEESSKAIKLLKGHPSDYRISLINHAAACFGLKRFDEYLDIFMKLYNETSDDQLLWKGVYAYRIASGHLELEDWPNAEKYFDISNDILARSKTKDYYFQTRSRGVFYLKTNRLEQARNCFEEILKDESEHSFPVPFKMDVLYWMEQIPDCVTNLERKISCRAHLAFHPCSYALGKQYPKDNPIPQVSQYGANYVPNDNDCWVIENNDIHAANYENIISRYNNSHQTVLDLFSGVLLNRKNFGSVEVLSELQSMCLAGVLGCGSIGANKWLLIDFVYRQDFFQPANGEERIKSLMKSLKKNDFEIKRKKNSFFMDIPEGITIIPMSHTPRSPMNLYKSRFKRFKRKELEVFFNIRPTTAKTWISQWLEAGGLAVEGKGKSTVYFFPE